MHTSQFTAKVIKMVRSIPEGKVATYGQIAKLAGKPQGSRGVGWILHSCATSYKLPWHRVLNSKGQISFEEGTHNFRQQKRRLEREGVEFQSGGKLSLSKYQWKKNPPTRKAKKKGPQIFSD